LLIKLILHTPQTFHSLFPASLLKTTTLDLTSDWKLSSDFHPIMTSQTNNTLSLVAQCDPVTTGLGPETQHNRGQPIARLPQELLLRVFSYAEEDEAGSSSLWIRLMQVDSTIFGPAAAVKLYGDKTCTISIFPDGVSIAGCPHLDLYEQSMVANAASTPYSNFLGCDAASRSGRREHPQSPHVFTKCQKLEIRFVGSAATDTDPDQRSFPLRMLRNASILVDRIVASGTVLKELRIVVEEAATTSRTRTRPEPAPVAPPGQGGLANDIGHFMAGVAHWPAWVPDHLMEDEQDEPAPPRRRVTWSSTWSNGGRRSGLEPHPVETIDTVTEAAVRPRWSPFVDESRIEIVCAAFWALRRVGRASVCLMPPSLERTLGNWREGLVREMQGEASRREGIWTRWEMLLNQVLEPRSGGEEGDDVEMTELEELEEWDEAGEWDEEGDEED
jgi:hypothetical protein